MEKGQTMRKEERGEVLHEYADGMQICRKEGLYHVWTGDGRHWKPDGFKTAEEAYSYSVKRARFEAGQPRKPRMPEPN